ncbi:ABC transporter ATP-binding protein [Dongia soli]|uniref:ABC transporter ATP-binding protein n=1 Tax=Dongia soli TaxID=600628 RepID=A0ABU5EB79_9PROT|nr:ABC transporter ATP-binding protein [Dongia soli]MDY0883132.1 ABC transporter ATP-binding protein [Dongia soli]
MIVMMFAKFVLSMAGMVFVGQEVANLSTRLRLRLIDGIMKARWGFFTSQPTGRFTAAVSTDSDRAATAFKQAGLIFAKFVEILVYFVGALFISWQFSVAAVVLCVLLWIAVSRYMRMAKRAGRGKTKYNQRLAGAVTEVLTNIKALKAMNRHGHIAAVFDTDIDKLSRALRRENDSNAAVVALQDPLLAGFLVTGIYFGYNYFGMPFEALVATIWLLRRIAAKIGEIRAGMQGMFIDSSAFWSTVALIEETEIEAEQMQKGSSMILQNEARFADVSFAYPSRDVMKDINIAIEAGKVTTIIGPSGSGKTTIADLLVGLHQPRSGQVLIDGMSLKDGDLRQWRNRIGYIPQDNILFNDTVAQNVTLGDATIDNSRIEAALKLAGAWQFVSRLPAGLDEMVGVRGNLLSGGQRQRLSIARALINDPNLLILDEATSALDHDTALEICDSVRSLAGQRTILAITHQSLWIDAADRIYEMENGSVTLAEKHSS